MGRKHAAHTYRVHHLLKQVDELRQDPDQLLYDYGIEIDEAGRAFDGYFQRTFETITEWAEFTVTDEMADEEEEPEYGSRFPSDE